MRRIFRFLISHWVARTPTNVREFNRYMLRDIGLEHLHWRVSEPERSPWRQIVP